VLFVPPFGEEMNKSRRQFADTAKDLVANGFAVLLVDLFGTGDSSGEFSQARWPTWKGDLAAAVSWVRAKGFYIDAVVAIRLGCSLVAEALIDIDCRISKTVFWQPVTNGKQYMNQFLRLRSASSMMKDNKETVEELRQRLVGAETLEISGYELSPDLWRDIEAVDLLPCLGSQLGQLKVYEIGRPRADGVSPVTQRLLAAAEGSYVDASAQRVVGEPFWTATEIAVNDELRNLTVDFLVREAAT
jgi:exosortase A-associated hydrolase 2